MLMDVTLDAGWSYVDKSGYVSVLDDLSLSFPSLLCRFVLFIVILHLLYALPPIPSSLPILLRVMRSSLSAPISIEYSWQ